MTQIIALLGNKIEILIRVEFTYNEFRSEFHRAVRRYFVINTCRMNFISLFAVEYVQLPDISA